MKQFMKKSEKVESMEIADFDEENGNAIANLF